MPASGKHPPPPARGRIGIKQHLLLGVLALFVLLAAYTVFDNNRVTVRRETVTLRDLPPSFDGFTILQISDLHGKRFGARQQRLARLINRLDYDMIAITGDLLPASGDKTPFLELLSALERKELVFYNGGNTGPHSHSMFTGVKTPDGLLLESLGVRLLDYPQRVERGGEAIWVSDAFLYPRAEAMVRSAQEEIPIADELVQAILMEQMVYYLALAASFDAIGPEDTLVCITHFPFTRSMLESGLGGALPYYDLVLAGHFHGGQFRLPLIGALYIPDATIRGGLFPPDEIVSGLNTWGGARHYVSRGLGASDTIPLLAFRLFNPPEVNLITLKKNP
jgi:uncharacterized protein